MPHQKLREALVSASAAATKMQRERSLELGDTMHHVFCMERNDSKAPLRDDGYTALPRGETTASHTADDEESEVVQFSSSMYYVLESEQRVKIDVMRIGPQSDTCISVSYETRDASARGGIDYVSSSGHISFQPAEIFKEIQVDLVPGSFWRTAMDFQVALFDPVGCKCGVDLHQSRVTIIDEDCFPSPNCKAILKQGNSKEAIKHALKHEFSPLLLFWEFWKLVFNHAGVFRYSITLLIIDQLWNVYNIICMFIPVYLVNTVLNTHDSEAKDRLVLPTRQTLYVLGAAYILPMFLLHACEYLKEHINLRARCATWVGVNLFRKLLNLSDASRLQFETSEITAALDTDIDVVSLGYVQIIVLLKIFVKVALTGCFSFYTAPSGLWIVILMPAIAAVWSLHRFSQALLLPGTFQAVSSMQNIVTGTLKNIDFFSCFDKRALAVDVLEARQRDITTCDLGRRLFLLNTRFFVKWMTPAMTAFYLCTAAYAVLEGTLSLGGFLALLKAIHDTGADCEELFTGYSTLSLAFKPLERLTVFFNQPTELLQRLQEQEHRRGVSHEKRAQMHAQVAHGGPVAQVPDDVVSIQLVDVEVVAHTGHVFKRSFGGQAVPQGQVLAVTGHHGCGKSILLKLIAARLLPSQGSIFVPMHLRTVFISETPIIFSAPAYQNLICGLPDGRAPDYERIKRILTTLKLHGILSQLSAELEAQTEDCTGLSGEGLSAEDCADLSQYTPQSLQWMNTLSLAELCLLNLARALISDPEVLLLQKPFSNFSSTCGEVVWEALRAHVSNRGLLMPEESIEYRRPRTLLFSTHLLKYVTRADSVWQVSRDEDTGTNWILALDPREYELHKETADDLGWRERQVETMRVSLVT